MTGGRWIAMAGMSALMLVAPANLRASGLLMGVDHVSVTYGRAPWLSMAILDICAVIGATNIYLIVRNRGRL